MKKQVKMQLLDGKTYELTPLSLKKATGYRKLAKAEDAQKNTPHKIRFDKLSRKNEAGLLSEEELEEFVELEEKLEADDADDEISPVFIAVIRECLSVKQPSFALTGDSDKDEQINVQITDLFDIKSLQIAFRYALSGSYDKEDSDYFC